MVWPDTGKFVFQSRFALFTDYTMTNAKNFSLAIIVDFVPDGKILEDRKFAICADVILNIGIKSAELLPY
jgi:hypothetical protein